MKTTFFRAFLECYTKKKHLKEIKEQRDKTEGVQKLPLPCRMTQGPPLGTRKQILFLSTDRTLEESLPKY